MDKRSIHDLWSRQVIGSALATFRTPVLLCARCPFMESANDEGFGAAVGLCYDRPLVSRRFGS
jgi:hypothetical protein